MNDGTMFLFIKSVVIEIYFSILVPNVLRIIFEKSLQRLASYIPTVNLHILLYYKSHK